MFDETRTKLPPEKLSGNVGEKVGVDDPEWSNESVFKDFNNGDYTLKETTNSSVRDGGLVVDLDMIKSIIGDKASKISAESIMEILSMDRNGNARKDSWSIGAYQY